MSNLFAVILLRFFRLILAFLHSAYSSVEYFDSAQNFIRRKLKKLFLHTRTVPDPQSHVSSFVKELKKCPSHFVVVLGSDGISFEDFTNLVIWCLAAKITFLSFYDYSGNLKANQNTYYKYLISKGKVNPSCLSFPSDKHNPINGVSNKIYLSFLSMEDGKPLLVQLARDIGKKVVGHQMSLDEIDEQFISKELFKLNGIPDPELALICGPVCSSFGLLPWHIRVTEFLQLGTIRGIQVTDFTNILEAYSNCDQRFGK